MSDERRESEAPEGSVAIDLSRRKGSWRKDAVRASLIEVTIAAAPYLTMTRIAVAQLSRSRLARLGALALASLALVAVFAVLLAS